jgi:endonuclease YncB( thermonuclease family)
MAWGRPRSRRPSVFRPRRRLPWRWAAAGLLVLALAVGVDRVREAFVTPSPVAERAPPAVPSASGAVWAGRAHVLDADTIEVRGRRIRLHGIDAPENDQMCERNGRPWRCGREATEALRGHLGGRSVTCHELDVDRFGRSVARCLVNGQDVNAWLVRNGWAIAYRRFSEAYVTHEAEARAARRGIWSGRFEMPEAHRHSGR